MNQVALGTLEQNVIVLIRKKETRKIGRGACIAGVLAIASCVGAFIAVSFVVRSVTQSEFLDYVSLIGSDTNAVVTYSKELFLSLFDALPIVGIVAALATFGILVWSSTRTVTYSVFTYKSSRLI